jgi:hypothetical protein
MTDANILPLSHATPVPGQSLSAQPTHIDITTGHVFDAAGNGVGKWSPMQDTVHLEQNKALADYAGSRSARATACSIATNGFSTNRDLVLQQARDVIALSSANAEQRAQALDIGTADVHIPSAMPNFISGYKNEGPVADIFSPPLIVTKSSDKYYQYDKADAYQRAIPMLGAGGTQTMEVIPRFASTQYNTVSRAIGGFVTTEVEANQDAPLRIKQGTLRRMVNAALMEREIRVASMARTSGNWNSATTLNANYQWNSGSLSDPVKDINTVQESSYGKVSGAIIPEHIWNAMRRNPAVRSYYTYSGSAPGMVSEEQLMSLLQLPTVYVARMKYIDSAGALKYVWGNDVVLFRSPEQIPPMDQEDVATSYTFRWNMGGTNVPDASQLGGGAGPGFIVRQFFNQYRGPLGGVQMVLTHSDAEKMTSAFIGNLLINAYQ